MFRTFFVFATLALLACMTAAAFAAGIDGKWTASVPGREGKTQELSFVFKTAGGKLTGTIVNPMFESEIQDGKIDGANISFKQTFPNNTAVTVYYKGAVSGDSIEFIREAKGGAMDGRSSKFTAKRAK